MIEPAIRLLLFIGLIALQIVWVVTSPVPVITEYRYFYKRRSAQFIAIISIMLLLQLTNVISLPMSLASPFFSFMGLLFFLLGIALAVWAKLAMKSNWGTPAQHDRTRQKQLITAGPFAFSRNPIYVGLFIQFIGFELAMQSVLILLAFPLFWIIRNAVRKEESLLTKFFGKPYLAYCKNVPRFL